MKIFNIIQANYFIENGCLVIGCSIGDKCKVCIVFKEDKLLEKYKKIWDEKTRDMKGDL